VTRNPTTEWLARQITEAFPWERAPKYLIRDNDRAFGVAFKARVRDRPTSFRSPWQNGYVERLIGTIRRECIDHLIVLNAAHLRRILAKYTTFIMKCVLTGSYLKKSLDRNTTGPSASTDPSKNLRDARSSIASRSRTN
jgi:transposase InsO family protein